jgi:hypothetical protein
MQLFTCRAGRMREGGIRNVQKQLDDKMAKQIKGHGNDYLIPCPLRVIILLTYTIHESKIMFVNKN